MTLSQTEMSLQRYNAEVPMYFWNISPSPTLLTRNRGQGIQRLMRSLRASAVRQGLEMTAFVTIFATFLSSVWLLG